MALLSTRDLGVAFGAKRAVDGFTLDPTVGEFVLSHPDMRIPDECKCLSANTNNRRNWLPETCAFVDELGTGQAPYKTTSARYVGTLVADVHRNLIQGTQIFGMIAAFAHLLAYIYSPWLK